jgi:CRP-like cAMP-binding protein
MLLKYKNITDDALRLAISQFDYKRYEAGSIIFKQGEESLHFFIIVRGSVIIKRQKKRKSVINKSYKYINITYLIFLIFRLFNYFGSYSSFNYTDRHDDFELEEQNVVILNQGQYFGDVGISNKKIRNASAIAVDDCDILILEKSIFEVSIGVINIFIN